LQWDIGNLAGGLVTINTPRTKALLGFADNHPVTLGGMTLEAGDTQLGWCTLGLTLVRGEVFTNDCTALIIATGWWENSGQLWKDANKDSVGNQWGHAPALTEVVPFTVTLPVATNIVRLWALDEQGQRKAALPVTGDDTSTVITITTDAASIWYELEVARWVASFDLWRARHFSEEELSNPEISGEDAAPDGDGVANLWKYLLGLPGRTLVPSDRLPRAELLSVSNQLFMAMTVDRDKLVEDVISTAEVSPDLASWLSGHGHTRMVQTTDLGDFERVTIRDLTPAATSPHRYMRFRLQRQ
jgi:hypothetical protein